MKFRQATGVRIEIPRAAIETVFDECERYNRDETGGRLIGNYSSTDGSLTIVVTGVIEPGPNAERTPTYLMQDGDYQEKVFRTIESKYPDVEHLGNWHTHHVNGLPHLSAGDLETYGRIVNHQYHNTDFFYALLITGRHSRARYTTKHYLFRRGESHVLEVPTELVDIVDRPLVWTPSQQSYPETVELKGHVAHQQRAFDNDALKDFFPRMRPYQSKDLGLYWRGPIELVDGTAIELVVVESSDESGALSYTVMLRNPPAVLGDIAETLQANDYPTARAALIRAERECNRAVFTRGREAI